MGEEAHPSNSEAQSEAEAAVQKHKVATDALKLLAIRDAHPTARLILAFADRAAAESIRGWRAATPAANGIELRPVDLDPVDRVTIEAAQHRQRMVNPS